MRSTGVHRSFNPPITGDPLKCVWMLAGVVGYKLCDREYDCEHCAFDLAMRETPPSLAHQPSAAPEAVWSVPATTGDQAAGTADIMGYELAGSLFYHPGHVWARVEEEGRVRVGLDDFGQQLVGRVYSVNLPAPGDRVSPRGGCWRIAHQCGEATLAAPVTGVVHHVNEKLAQHPSLINHDPYHHGWAMVIGPDDLMGSLKDLYFGEHSRRWYEQEVERLHQELVGLAGPPSDLGVTLQDGGRRIEDLTRVIESRQLRQMIDRFLSPALEERGDRR
jgi:glycine cleavage system H lipoate-binding protein